MEQTQEHADVVAPPPLLYAGTLLAGLLLQRVARLPAPPRPLRWLGLLLGGAGLALGGWGFATLRRAGTEVRPDRPSSVLVTSGPYRFTRNPLYLSLALLCGGISLRAGAAAPLALLPGLLAVVQWGVIGREERYLERRFGEAYRAYRGRVRRWL